MKTKKSVELVKEGDFVAEVPVELLYEDHEWSPHLSRLRTCKSSMR
jgi:hypothetical protein